MISVCSTAVRRLQSDKSFCQWNGTIIVRHEDDIIPAIKLLNEGVLENPTSSVKASSGRDVLDFGSCGIRTDVEPELTREVSYVS